MPAPFLVTAHSDRHANAANWGAPGLSVPPAHGSGTIRSGRLEPVARRLARWAADVLIADDADVRDLILASAVLSSFATLTRAPRRRMIRALDCAGVGVAECVTALLAKRCASERRRQPDGYRCGQSDRHL